MGLSSAYLPLIDPSLGNWLITEMDFFFKENFLDKGNLRLRLLIVISRKSKSHNF